MQLITDHMQQKISVGLNFIKFQIKIARYKVSIPYYLGFELISRTADEFYSFAKMLLYNTCELDSHVRFRTIFNISLKHKILIFLMPFMRALLLFDFDNFKSLFVDNQFTITTPFKFSICITMASLTFSIKIITVYLLWHRY